MGGMRREGPVNTAVRSLETWSMRFACFAPEVVLSLSVPTDPGKRPSYTPGLERWGEPGRSCQPVPSPQPAPACEPFC